MLPAAYSRCTMNHTVHCREATGASWCFSVKQMQCVHTLAAPSMTRNSHSALAAHIAVL
jgi:hypothetical protein